MPYCFYGLPIPCSYESFLLNFELARVLAAISRGSYHISNACGENATHFRTAGKFL